MKRTLLLFFFLTTNITYSIEKPQIWAYAGAGMPIITVENSQVDYINKSLGGLGFDFAIAKGFSLEINPFFFIYPKHTAYTQEYFGESTENSQQKTIQKRYITGLFNFILKKSWSTYSPQFKINGRVGLWMSRTVLKQTDLSTEIPESIVMRPMHAYGVAPGVSASYKFLSNCVMDISLDGHVPFFWVKSCYIKNVFPVGKVGFTYYL